MSSYFTPTVRRRLALALLLVGTLGNVGFLQRVVKKLRADETTHPWAAYFRRAERFAEQLPQVEVLGYIGRSGRQCATNLRDNRQGLMQYAAAPRWLDSTTLHEFVLVDVDETADDPLASQPGAWTPIADDHQGMRLYRRTGAPPQ